MEDEVKEDEVKEFVLNDKQILIIWSAIIFVVMITTWFLTNLFTGWKTIE